ATKKVSVIIPNYNYANYLEERIDSILRQSYPIDELIILDDASTDNSIEVIDKVLAKYDLSNIKVIKEYNKKNSGSVFTQWQKGIKLVSNDYYWIAEADDSSNPCFLETMMKAFDDEEVVISYAESLTMNEDNKVTAFDCRAWMTAASETKWNKSYINDGISEIREALCVLNTIPNVSAVVFKKKNQIDILEDCKKFKISGDWYLYYTLLKDGKISYCSKSLNYFRKHSTSTSTTLKKEFELEELLTIQNEIRTSITLDTEHIHKQSYRYGGIINEVDKKTVERLKPLMAKKIAWIIPHPIKGSGGIRTMIQNANYLVTQGYEVDLYIEEDFVNTNESMKEIIANFYGECLCNAYVGIELRKEYDLVFATYSVLTPDYVSTMNVPKKAYFIQDFEPWFEPMGGMFLEMERTYKLGLEGISIGNWLANKLSNEFGTHMHSFAFCADLKVYKKLDKVKKENAVCFIYQPEKARRCADMGLKALQIVKKLRPKTKIYLYGSDTGDMSGMGFDNLQIMKIDKCNELYNKCKVGLCISSSNPSRIPFEMMAAGLPVVDLYRENNFYDIPEDGVLLADSTPEALATALIKILDDEKLQEKMGKAGMNFMKDYPLEKGFEQFGKFVDDLLNDKLDSKEKHERIYNREDVLPSDEVLKVRDIIAHKPMPINPTSKRVRNLVRIKKGLIRRYQNFIRRLFRV
ncbi:MAG: glycosyltransferase, partial [Bacilli bacterium]|nr:glycosyltransferase [Bacilli bacterium]